MADIIEQQLREGFGNVLRIFPLEEGKKYKLIAGMAYGNGDPYTIIYQLLPDGKWCLNDRGGTVNCLRNYSWERTLSQETFDKIDLISQEYDAWREETVIWIPADRPGFDIFSFLQLITRLAEIEVKLDG